MPDHETPDVIGKSFGRYRIVDRLGEGGMGSVWKAEDTLLHRSVALKFLSAELADSVEARQRFLREARAASVLDHPGIATVYDAGEIDGTPYLAVQLIEGTTISDRIGRGPLPVPEAVEIHRQASEALTHAHSRSVLHRDISSRNLMLKPDGSVVLVDFGLAKKSDMTQLTRTGTTQGTIAYLAPEVLEGSPATEASDRYSLGVVLYEMLTGVLPFQGERVEAVMLKIMTEDPEPPSNRRPEVTAEVDRTVLTLLRKDPGDRGSWEATVHTVGGVAAPGDPMRHAKSPTTGHPAPAAPPRSTRTGANRQGFLIGSGVLGLVLLTAVLLWQKPWQRPVGRTLPAGTFRSIAVLPLENASQGTEESDFLAEGIAGEIAAKLTGLPNLEVTPWVTSRRFSDLTHVGESGKTLDVEVLLTGTFSRHGPRIQVNVALIHVASETQIWASVFEEPTGDVFQVQRRIATKVATELLGPLPAAEEAALAKPPAQNLDAYTLYLEGAQELQTETREASTKALSLFADALARDSTLEEAHVGIGAVLTSRYFHGWEGGEENLDLADQHFQEALGLDSDSIDALRGLVRVRYLQGDLRGQRDLRRRIEAMDTSRVEVRLALAESWTLGLWPERAIPLLQSVLTDDPANVGAAWFRVVALAWSRRFEECIDAKNSFEAMHGEDAEVLMWSSYSHSNLGQLDLARRDLERSIDLFGENSNLYIYLHAWALYEVVGEPKLAQQCLDLLEAIARPVVTVHSDQKRIVLILAVAEALNGNRGRLDQEVGRLLNPAGRGLTSPYSIDLMLLPYWKMGDREKCRQILDTVISNEKWIYGHEGRLSIVRYPEILTDPILAPRFKTLLARRDELL